MNYKSQMTTRLPDWLQLFEEAGSYFKSRQRSKWRPRAECEVGKGKRDAEQKARSAAFPGGGECIPTCKGRRGSSGSPVRNACFFSGKEFAGAALVLPTLDVSPLPQGGVLGLEGVGV